MPPTLSVIMAVRNGAPFVRQAIESVLEQSYGDFEFLIVDDASTDDTVEIIRSFDDPRIHLIRNETNLGPFAAANVALERAQGKYVARMDGDDVSLPNRFARQVETLDAFPDVALVSSEYEVIDGNDRVVPGKRNSGRAAESDVVAWHLLFYNRLGGHSQVMFRRDAALAVGGYPTDYRYSRDYALWVRLLERGRIVILPQVLLQYRSHSRAISRSLARVQREHSLPATRSALSRHLDRDVPLEVVGDARALYIEGQRPLDHLPDVVRLLEEAYANFAGASGGTHLSRSTLREIRSFVSGRLFRHSIFAWKHGHRSDAWLAFRAAFRWSPTATARRATQLLLYRRHARAAREVREEASSVTT